MRASFLAGSCGQAPTVDEVAIFHFTLPTEVP
jgi:hypothetical protein